MRRPAECTTATAASYPTHLQHYGHRQCRCAIKAWFVDDNNKKTLRAAQLSSWTYMGMIQQRYRSELALYAFDRWAICHSWVDAWHVTICCKACCSDQVPLQRGCKDWNSMATQLHACISVKVMLFKLHELKCGSKGSPDIPASG